MGVLEVIVKCEKLLGSYGATFSQDKLGEARAAIAELIEAAECVSENEDDPRFLYGAIEDLRESIAKVRGE